MGNSGKVIYEMDADLADYSATVAKALAAVRPCKPPYGGEFYVSEAVISYDGDPTDVMVVADEHGGYGVRVQIADTQGRSNEVTAV